MGLQAPFSCVFPEKDAEEGSGVASVCAVNQLGAAAKEPRRDASRAQSFKTFHAFYAPNHRRRAKERQFGGQLDTKELVLSVQFSPADCERSSIVWPRPFDPSASLHSRTLPLRTTTPRVRLSEALDIPAVRWRLQRGRGLKQSSDRQRRSRERENNKLYDFARAEERFGMTIKVRLRNCHLAAAIIGEVTASHVAQRYSGFFLSLPWQLSV